MREAREPIAEGSPVLDVGCGGGRWLRVLTEEGVPEERLHGVDLIPERVAAASRSLPDADVQMGDGSRRLPYGDGSFGLVLMFTVLSSMHDRGAAAAAVAEAGRVLRTGGLLAIYEPAIPNPVNRARLTIRPGEVASWGSPLMKVRSTTRLTVAPPLARGLGHLSPRIYDLLGKLPFLLTHRLSVLERR